MEKVSYKTYQERERGDPRKYNSDDQWGHHLADLCQ